MSYAFGYDFARNLAESGEQIDSAAVVKAVQDGLAKKDPAITPDQAKPALEAFQKRQQARAQQAKAEYDKVAAENKTKSDQFLAANRGKSGIVALPSGIQYRVIEEGTGARPAASSEVKIHFRGSLYTGQEFASTYTGNEPVSMVVGEAPLSGLREVLPLMRVGARWEVFLPPDQAYGDSPRSPIGPGQAVVFDVKLVAIN